MRVIRFFVMLSAVLTVSLGSPGVVRAQDASPAKTIEERLEELEKEIRVLKRLKEVEQEVKAKKEAETPVVSAGRDGFSIKSKNNDYQLKLKGYVQVDGRAFVENKGTDTFTPRRVRPILEGTVFKYFDFRIMPDFGDGAVRLVDAYVDAKYWKWASLKVGKYKYPIGLERLQSITNSSFVELALPTNLVPNRDVGIDLHGDFFDGALNYDLGVFNNAYDGASVDFDNFDYKDIAGRVFSHPFKNTSYDVLNGLGVGVATSFGKSHGTTASPQLPSYKTSGQQTFFSYRSDGTAAGTTIAEGTRFRISPQGYYYYGPLGIMTEYVVSNQGVKRGNSTGNMGNQAMEVTGSYVLTGENASYNGVTPRYDFDPRKGKWGAFEFVSRYHWLGIDKGAFVTFANPATAAKEAQGYGVGLNWYLNKNIKFMLDYEQTFFEGGGLNGGTRNTESLFTTRAQISF